MQRGPRWYVLCSVEASDLMVECVAYSFGVSFIRQVQSRIKAVEKMDAEAPEPVEMDATWRFSIPCSEPLGRPIIQIDDVTFDYEPTQKTEEQFLLQRINFGVDNSSKIAILGANGQGKTTLRKSGDNHMIDTPLFCRPYRSHRRDSLPYPNTCYMLSVESFL